MLRLASKTDLRYVDVALADADAVARLLVDHAHCEHKAAITGLSFVSKYPDDPFLVRSLSALAAEEAAHFARMVAICITRGLTIGHPEPDVYVKRLLAAVRTSTLVEQRIDRLLVCAFIEARSCERLQLLADGFRAHGDVELAALYDELWREEAGHHALFVDLATRTANAASADASAVRELQRVPRSVAVLHPSRETGGGVDDVAARLDVLARHEADVLADVPLRPAIH